MLDCTLSMYWTSRQLQSFWCQMKSHSIIHMKGCEQRMLTYNEHQISGSTSTACLLPLMHLPILCPMTLHMGYSRTRWRFDYLNCSNIWSRPHNWISSKLIGDYWRFDTYSATIQCRENVAVIELVSEVIKFRTIGAASFSDLCVIFCISFHLLVIMFICPVS